MVSRPLAFIALGGALLVAALSVGGALALFSGSASVSGNTVATDTLDPPTGLTAAAGAPAPRIELNWTATGDGYASGYRVLRASASGGPYSQIAEVTPRTATSYTDTTVTGGTTYFYVLRSFYQGWESADSSEASATP